MSTTDAQFQAETLPIFWLKYLDAIFGRMERSQRIAGMLNAIAIK